MRRPTVILSAFFLLASATMAADPTPIALFTGRGDVDVVATGSGYAAAVIEDGTVSFQRLDPSGQLAGSQVNLGDLGTIPFRVAIVSAGKGFVVYAQGPGPVSLYALPIDADGAPSGSVNKVVPFPALGAWDVVDTGHAHLVVCEDFAVKGFRVFSQVVRYDGTPDGDPTALVPLSGAPGIPEALDLAATSGGYLAAWAEKGLAIGARGLRASGRPDGTGPDTAADSGECPHFVATIGGSVRGGIVYVNGCDGWVPTLRLRGSNGFGPPTLLDIEGRTVTSYGLIPIAADGPRDRIGLAVATPLTDPQDFGAWVFGEYDLDGKRLTSLVDLRTTYGVITFSMRVLWDGARDSYVLSWVGVGPQGEGAYILRVPRQN